MLSGPYLLQTASSRCSYEILHRGSVSRISSCPAPWNFKSKGTRHRVALLGNSLSLRVLLYFRFERREVEQRGQDRLRRSINLRTLSSPRKEGRKEFLDRSRENQFIGNKKKEEGSSIKRDVANSSWRKAMVIRNFPTVMSKRSRRLRSWLHSVWRNKFGERSVLSPPRVSKRD